MSAVPPDAGSPPLARLFAVAFRSLIDALHVELRARGWHDVRPAYGFVLLAAADAPTAVTDLATLLGTTKQAASKLVDAMVVAGYVRREPAPGDRRRRPVALTARGRALLAAVEDIYRDLERRWADVIGPAAVERMRGDLVTVLTDGPDGRLPPVRPTAGDRASASRPRVLSPETVAIATVSGDKAGGDTLVAPRRPPAAALPPGPPDDGFGSGDAPICGPSVLIAVTRKRSLWRPFPEKLVVAGVRDPARTTGRRRRRTPARPRPVAAGGTCRS